MITTRSFALAAFVVFVLALPAAAQTGGREAGAATVRSDFNGDGFADLAVGVPFEDVGSVVDAGAVNVIYGSANGLVVAGNQFWHQDSPGVTGVPETGDHFGWAIAPGDFDGDGLTDLAIGIPDESTSFTVDGRTSFASDEGGVQLLRGTRTGGLVAWRYLNILSATGNSTDGAFCYCRFGAALAAGDFNDDGKDDLAIGMPDKDLQGHFVFPERYQDSGVVTVVYGSGVGQAGLGFTLVALANDDAPAYQRNELAGTEIWDDRRFGAALAAGDHDGDGRDDLAIEAQRGDEVFIVFGSQTGVRTDTHRSYAVPDLGAWALALADVDRDGKQDLFVGAPFDDPGGVADAGSVLAFHGNGVKRKITQGSLPGVAAEAGDRFGWALASGDFDRDGSPDLAIGTPDEDTTSGADTGIVTVLSSFGGVLDTQSAKTWSQASAGVPGAVEAGDRFGTALAAWNFGKGLAADLAIGVPFENFAVGSVVNAKAGVVDVLYGSQLDGLTGTGAQDWSQATTGLLGGFESNDRFGLALGGR